MNLTEFTSRLTEALRNEVPFNYGNETFNLRNRQTRIDVIGRITCDYLAEYGHANIDTTALERMADAILYEELTDANPHKVAYNEYPILSDSQLRKRRKRGELTLSVLDDVSSDHVGEIKFDDSTARFKYEIEREVRRFNAINRRQRIRKYNLIDEMGEKAFREAYPIIPNPLLLFRGREHAEWSLDVRRRDGFRCRKCGKKSARGMHAHHIESWSTAIELRYDVDNGITLCKNCHAEFHSLYGKRRNTRQQLEEWMGVAADELHSEIY